MSDRPMVSGALMLDMRYVYAAVPIAFTLQAVRLVERGGVSLPNVIP